MRHESALLLAIGEHPNIVRHQGFFQGRTQVLSFRTEGSPPAHSSRPALDADRWCSHWSSSEGVTANSCCRGKGACRSQQFMR